MFSDTSIWEASKRSYYSYTCELPTSELNETKHLKSQTPFMASHEKKKFTISPNLPNFVNITEKKNLKA